MKQILKIGTLIAIILVMTSWSVHSQKLNIELSKNELQVDKKDSIMLRFYLKEAMTTNIKFVNIFGGDEIEFENDKKRKKGWHTINISSDSIELNNFGSGVYYLDFISNSSKGRNLNFNSFREPWGSIIEVKNPELNNLTGIINYELPTPSFVKVRVGYSNGPLIKTIADLKFQNKGNQQEVWDGYDQSGRTNLLGKVESIVQVIAYSIPPTCIILRNPEKEINYSASSEYPENWKKYALSPYAKVAWNDSYDVGVEFQLVENADTTITFTFSEQASAFHEVFLPSNEIYISIDPEVIVETPDVAIPGTYTITIPPTIIGKRYVLVNIIFENNRIAAGMLEVDFNN